MIIIIASITFDVEQDCPPYLKSFRGIEEGMEEILKILEEKNVKTTFFFTAVVAKKFPKIAKKVADYGHEIGFHSYNHERFDQMGYSDAEKNLKKGLDILREFYDVKSFRAPNLKFPIKYFSILEKFSIHFDSSLTWYKGYFGGVKRIGSVLEIPPSVTSSFLRIPFFIQKPLFSFFPKPIVLFSHPWEYVEMKGVRFDCRFSTGEKALENLSKILDYLEKRKYKIVKIEDFEKFRDLF